MKKLTAKLLNKALEAEMDSYLGYEKNSSKGDNSGNSRNGYLRRYNFAKKAKSNLLCCYEDGHALTEAVISALIGKIRRKDNNIDKRFHFHCLRHKFITLTGNSGIPMIQIKNIVGHANLKLTESVYYHNSNEKNLESIKTVSIPLKVKK